MFSSFSHANRREKFDVAIVVVIVVVLLLEKNLIKLRSVTVLLLPAFDSQIKNLLSSSFSQ